MIVIPRYRINLKPLIPSGAGEVDSRKILRGVQKEVLKSIRDEIQKQAFSPRAKRALMAGVGTQMGPNSVKIIAKHPAFYPLLEGRKREQMTWLVKAKRPIPIITDDGELIFRSATPRSMARGRWYHPGRPGTTVIEKARKKTREVIKARVAKELQRQIRSAMRAR